MYRPTVRYDDQYRKYVDELFRATTLDRNQIIRLALFSAAYSKEFTDVTSLSQADWPRDQHRLWLEQTYTTEERREGAFPSISIPIRNQGGVVFKVN